MDMPHTDATRACEGPAAPGPQPPILRTRRPRVVVVPGLAVVDYLREAVRAAQGAGYDVVTFAAPGSVDAPAALTDYGHALAARLRAEPADLLVGLSVGAQAAAVAAAHAGDAVGRLMLVSPTVAPQRRPLWRLLGAWVAGGRHEPVRLLRTQLREWMSAGPVRIAATLRSTKSCQPEDVLTRVEARPDRGAAAAHGGAWLTVVHARDDVVCPHEYAAALAADAQGRLVVVPRGSHSWPYGDARGFVDVLDQATARGLSATGDTQADGWSEGTVHPSGDAARGVARPGQR